MQSKFSRARLAHYIAASNASSDVLAREVAAYLVTQGKTSELDSLMRDVAEIRAHELGIIELTARSAFALDAHTKAEIERVAKSQYVGARQVVIHEVHDDTAIGGVRVELANADLDLTIRNKLHKLRELVA